MAAAGERPVVTLPPFFRAGGDAAGEAEAGPAIAVVESMRDGDEDAAGPSSRRGSGCEGRRGSGGGSQRGSGGKGAFASGVGPTLSAGGCGAVTEGGCRSTAGTEASPRDAAEGEGRRAQTPPSPAHAGGHAAGGGGAGRAAYATGPTGDGGAGAALAAAPAAAGAASAVPAAAPGFPAYSKQFSSPSSSPFRRPGSGGTPRFQLLTESSRQRLSTAAQLRARGGASASPQCSTPLPLAGAALARKLVDRGGASPARKAKPKSKPAAPPPAAAAAAAAGPQASAVPAPPSPSAAPPLARGGGSGRLLSDAGGSKAASGGHRLRVGGASRRAGDGDPRFRLPERMASMPTGFVRSRRTAISSEPVSPSATLNWKPPVFAKTAEEDGRIEAVVRDKLVVLFGQLSVDNRKRVVAAMSKRKVKKGEVIIRQNDDGDNFYIIDSGQVDIFVKRRDKDVADKVLEATAGMSFGELALMYNAPRAATCVAVSDAVLWALDRQSFRMLLVSAECTKKRRYESLLENIAIFKCLTKLERVQLCDILAVLECKKGDCIIRQGRHGDKFFIVESGELSCKMREAGGDCEIEVQRYTRGGFFGELALITSGGIRNASVYVEEDGTRLLWIGKSTFDRVLGPIIDVLRRHASAYPTYAQLLEKRAAHSGVAEPFAPGVC